MRDFNIEDRLKKKLKKILKKDKIAYLAIRKKMEEILTCRDVEHYKNLRSPLEHLKRVHIKSSFVLVFKYVVNEDKILFYDYDHHDSIYKTS
jgi:YafQ family addiction module toxin component